MGNTATDKMHKTIKADRRYLKALEVLALEEMEGEQSPENLDEARKIVTQANLNRTEEL